MTGKLTNREILFLSICSQLPIGIITSIIVFHIATNFIVAVISVLIVTIPIGWIVVWFADKVKQ